MLGGIDRSTPTLAPNQPSDCWHSQGDHEATETDQAKHPRHRDRERKEVQVTRFPEDPLAGKLRSEEGFAFLENHDAVAGGRVEACGGIDRRLVVAVMTDDEATFIVAGVEDSAKAPDVFPKLRCVRPPHLVDGRWRKYAAPDRLAILSRKVSLDETCDV